MTSRSTHNSQQEDRRVSSERGTSGARIQGKERKGAASMMNNAWKTSVRRLTNTDDLHQHSEKEESSSSESSMPSTVGKDSSAGAAREEVERLALKETKDVWTWKFFVVLIILSTAGFMSAAAYKFLEDSEADDFVDSVSLVV